MSGSHCGDRAAQGQRAALPAVALLCLPLFCLPCAPRHAPCTSREIDLLPLREILRSQSGRPHWFPSLASQQGAACTLALGGAASAAAATAAAPFGVSCRCRTRTRWRTSARSATSARVRPRRRKRDGPRALCETQQAVHCDDERAHLTLTRAAARELHVADGNSGVLVSLCARCRAAAAARSPSPLPSLKGYWSVLTHSSWQPRNDDDVAERLRRRVAARRGLSVLQLLRPPAASCSGLAAKRGLAGGGGPKWRRV